MSLQQDQQDIIDAEAALVALGPLSSANFDQALVQLAKRRAAQNDIQKLQNEQFRPDAFNLINQQQREVIRLASFPSSCASLPSIAQHKRKH